MLMMTFRNSTFLFFACCTMLVAQQEKRSYSQELLGIKDSWHKIELPVYAFAKASPYLTDLRIKGITASNDTVVAPYFLETTEEKIEVTEIPFKILNTTTSGATHYITFEAQQDKAINNMLLHFSNINYDWNVSLEGSHENSNWFTILNNYRILNIDNAFTSYTFNNLRFAATKYRYYRIAIPTKETPKLLKATLTQTSIIPGDYQQYKIKSTRRTEFRKDQQTQLFITLENAAPVSSISLKVANKTDYFRAVRILYVTDSIKTEKGYIRNYGNLTNGTISSREPAIFNVPSTYLKQLKLIIENGDNEPLDIKPEVIKGHKVQLIARFDKPATYLLTYGDHSLSRPNYDITQFKDRIPANLSTLKLGALKTQVTGAANATDPLFKNMLWLWLVVGIILIFVGWQTVKMIRK